MPDDTAESGSPTIGVVVVAYRSSATIGGCLRGVLADPGVVSVVVQDNSADESTRAVVESLDDARVRYASDANVGFAAGCNRGVERLADRSNGEAPVEWLAFVNPDVELERRLSALVTRRDLGSARIVGAQVDSPRSPGVLSARPAVTRRRELLKAGLGPRVYAIRSDAAARADVLFVAQVSGALLLLRRSDFEAWGGFDTRFELYYEDVDLCVRAPGGCAFVTEPWGRHAGGASSGSAAEVSSAAYVAGRVSRMRYLRKHLPGPLTEGAVVLTAALEAVARAVGRAAEGPAARRAGLRAQLTEWRRPGSVAVLHSLEPAGSVTGRGRPSQ